MFDIRTLHICGQAVDDNILYPIPMPILLYGDEQLNMFISQTEYMMVKAEELAGDEACFNFIISDCLLRICQRIIDMLIDCIMMLAFR
jgi:hypothetical protein